MKFQGKKGKDEGEDGERGGGSWAVGGERKLKMDLGDGLQEGNQ